MPDSSGTYQTASVPARVVQAGDMILVHHGRRRRARPATVRSRFVHADRILFRTSLGDLTVSVDAHIDAVLGKV